MPKHFKDEVAQTAPFQYEKEVFAKGLHFERPPLTFQSSKWEELARERLSAESWGYLGGSAGTGETNSKNLAAFKRWSILPSRLVKANFPDLTCEVLGEKHRYPIAVAPVGIQRVFNPEGEEASARAAAKNHIPYVMSMASSTSIEDVARASGDGPRWFQLYWPLEEHDDITISILKRAKAAGFTALFVTLDAYILGWRPSDMDNGWVVRWLHIDFELTSLQLQPFPTA